jgi:cbb3-type cytochrome oxidase subunit 3
VLWLEHYLVVVMAVLFVGIVVITFWPGRKANIEKQGRIPFEDDV